MLADYVLALIRSDAPDEEIRKASVENLEDFLKESEFAFRYWRRKRDALEVFFRPGLVADLLTRVVI